MRNKLLHPHMQKPTCFQLLFSLLPLGGHRVSSSHQNSTEFLPRGHLRIRQGACRSQSTVYRSQDLRVQLNSSEVLVGIRCACVRLIILVSVRPYIQVSTSIRSIAKNNRTIIRVHNISTNLACPSILYVEFNGSFQGWKRIARSTHWIVDRTYRNKVNGSQPPVSK